MLCMWAARSHRARLAPGPGRQAATRADDPRGAPLERGGRFRIPDRRSTLSTTVTVPRLHTVDARRALQACTGADADADNTYNMMIPINCMNVITHYEDGTPALGLGPLTKVNVQRSTPRFGLSRGRTWCSH